MTGLQDERLGGLDDYWITGLQDDRMKGLLDLHHTSYIIHLRNTG